MSTSNAVFADLAQLTSRLQNRLEKGLNVAGPLATEPAHTLACLLAALRLAGERLPAAAVGWVLDQLETGLLHFCDQKSWRRLLDDMREAPELADIQNQRDFAINGPSDDPLPYFYEHLLQGDNPGRRDRRGVFYTPRPLVRFIVRNVDRLLREEFRLGDGLADLTSWQEMQQSNPCLEFPAAATPETPYVQILDPAMGSGLFLVETIEQIHANLTDRWQCEGHDAQARQLRWNEYVPRGLLPRLHGLELMEAPYVLALVNLAVKLAETGYDFSHAVPLSVYRADTLADPPPSGDARDRVEELRRRFPITVIVGNPPFLANSSNRGPWIEDLLRGKLPGGRATAGYYDVAGQPLGERKLWLHDDYVKFIRYSQWRIEEATCGVIGLVTNHGYLDNPTFRGMREKLRASFARITVVDLHGNKKKREQSPDGSADENVFDIEQGVAVGFLRRLPGETNCRDSSCDVQRVDLWGTRQEKLVSLSGSTIDSLSTTPIKAQPPNYFFVAHDESLAEEYRQGFKLTEIMPINTTAPITARDIFVVALDETELQQRLGDFADPSIPDEEIRRRYFGNTRSPKYPPGDTRGWKLPQARRKLAAEPNWRRHITTCQFRAFDFRPIFWADWMIDWPRQDVMQHLLAGDNLALIARRQMLPTQPCNYFWITDRPALDGVIRSDNRGSESLFPLYTGDGQTRRANFSPAFIEAARKVLSLSWLDRGCGDLQQTFGPEDLLHYIYALFFLPTYRRRYADPLRIDFPRIFLPGSTELFRSLTCAGSELASLHLLRVESTPRRLTGQGEPLVAPGYPKHDGKQVSINAEVTFHDVSPEVWNYQVGGHQVCRKWLKDRRGRNLNAEELKQYGSILAAIEKTLALESAIDRAIKRHHGFATAFLTVDSRSMP